MQKIHPHRGFSLLELLAVVVILGLLAALVIPRVSSSGDIARQKVQDSQVASLNAAIDRYYFEYGVWPTSLDDLIGYFLADGVPENPLGGPYKIDAVTHRITWTP